MEHRLEESSAAGRHRFPVAGRGPPVDERAARPAQVVDAPALRLPVLGCRVRARLELHEDVVAVGEWDLIVWGARHRCLLLGNERLVDDIGQEMKERLRGYIDTPRVPWIRADLQPLRICRRNGESQQNDGSESFHWGLMVADPWNHLRNPMCARFP